MKFSDRMNPAMMPLPGDGIHSAFRNMNRIRVQILLKPEKKITR